MIQRIQTLFYLLTGAAFAGLFRFPFATTPEPVGQSDHIFSDAVYAVSDHIMLTVLTAIGILLAVVSMFMFKNRGRQLRLGYLMIVVAVLIMLVAIVYYLNQSAQLEGIDPDDATGIALPAVAIVCALAANYFVRKDERKVRSMDRLR